jgi:hypothetical protein
LKGIASLRHATCRHSLGVQLIRAFDQSPCVPECDVSRIDDVQDPPALGNLGIRKDVMVQKGSYSFHRGLQPFSITYAGRFRSCRFTARQSDVTPASLPFLL